MHADIWIVRNGTEYLLLHGHLRLHSTLNGSGAAFVEVAHEGVVKITRVSGCLQVDSGNGHFVFKEQQSMPCGKTCPTLGDGQGPGAPQRWAIASIHAAHSGCLLCKKNGVFLSLLLLSSLLR